MVCTTFVMRKYPKFRQHLYLSCTYGYMQNVSTNEETIACISYSLVPQLFLETLSYSGYLCVVLVIFFTKSKSILVLKTHSWHCGSSYKSVSLNLYISVSYMLFLLILALWHLFLFSQIFVDLMSVHVGPDDLLPFLPCTWHFSANPGPCAIKIEQTNNQS